MATLNQVKANLQQLALSHLQINHFYFGDTWEQLHNGDVLPPVCFCVLKGANINPDDKSKVLDFDLYFLDLSKASEREELEVQSDMLEVAQDIIAQLRHPSFEWIVTGDVSIDFVTEQTEDGYSGVVASVSLELPYESNRCSVPTDFSYDDDIVLLGNSVDNYFLKINP